MIMIVNEQLAGTKVNELNKHFHVLMIEIIGICKETNVAINFKKSIVGEKFNFCKSDKQEVITLRLSKRLELISEEEI